MGEMADFYIAQMQDAYGWNPVGSASRRSVTCEHCGAARLKWRETDAGWRLFSNERGQGNRKLMHNCLRVPASPDEFENCAPHTPQPADPSATNPQT